MVSIPAMEELDGFRSASLLVDRASGRAVSTATYGSREAMQRNREQAVAVGAVLTAPLAEDDRVILG